MEPRLVTPRSILSSPRGSIRVSSTPDPSSVSSARASAMFQSGSRRKSQAWRHRQSGVKTSMDDDMVSGVGKSSSPVGFGGPLPRMPSDDTAITDSLTQERQRRKVSTLATMKPKIASSASTSQLFHLRQQTGSVSKSSMDGGFPSPGLIVGSSTMDSELSFFDELIPTLRRRLKDVLCDCMVISIDTDSEEGDSPAFRKLKVPVTEKSIGISWLMSMACNPCVMRLPWTPDGVGALVAVGTMSGSLCSINGAMDILKESVDLSSDYIGHTKWVSQSLLVYANGNGQIVFFEADEPQSTGVVRGKKLMLIEYVKYVCSRLSEVQNEQTKAVPVAALDCILIRDSTETSEWYLLLCWVYDRSNLIQIAKIDFNVVTDLVVRSWLAAESTVDHSAKLSQILVIKNDNLRTYFHSFWQFNVYDPMTCLNRGISTDSQRFGCRRRHQIQAKALFSSERSRKTRLKAKMPSKKTLPTAKSLDMTTLAKESQSSAAPKLALSVSVGTAYETECPERTEASPLPAIVGTAEAIDRALSHSDRGRSVSMSPALLKRRERLERMLEDDCKPVIPLNCVEFSPYNQGLYLAVGNENSDFWVLRRKKKKANDKGVGELTAKKKKDERTVQFEKDTLLAYEGLYFYDSLMNDCQCEVIRLNYIKQQVCRVMKCGNLTHTDGSCGDIADVLRRNQGKVADLISFCHLTTEESEDYAVSRRGISDYSLPTSEIEALKGKSSIYNAVLAAGMAGIDEVTPAQIAWVSPTSLIRLKTKCELSQLNSVVRCQVNAPLSAQLSLSDYHQLVSESMANHPCLSSGLYSAYSGMHFRKRRAMIRPIVSLICQFSLNNFCQITDDTLGYCFHPFSEFLSRMTPSCLAAVPLRSLEPHSVTKSRLDGTESNSARKRAKLRDRKAKWTDELRRCEDGELSRLQGSFAIGCHDRSVLLFVEK